MALVDHQDRPPPKRAPLPTREQIEAITDIDLLAQIETEIERRAEKITVDLEMEVGDEDWDARARSALTAHRICLRTVRKRLHRLRGSGKLPQVDVDNARLEKKVAKSTALATIKTAEQERARAKAERTKAAALQQKIALVKGTSFHLHFFKAARTALTPDLFAQVEADAEARLLRALETITAEIEPNCSAQDNGAESIDG